MRITPTRAYCCMKWRYCCLCLLFFSLLTQFLGWSYLTLHKQPSAPTPLGRKSLRRHNNWSETLTSLEQRTVLDLNLDLLTHGKELATDAVVSDTESFPFRQKRLVEKNQMVQTVPGVDDVYARLEEYLHGLTQNHFHRDLATVKRMQKRTVAAELNALPMDPLNETDSISIRIQFLNVLARMVGT